MNEISINSILSMIDPHQQTNAIGLLDEFIRLMMHLTACASVTVSLLICMVMVLFLCASLLELVIYCANEAGYYLKNKFGLNFYHVLWVGW